MSENEQDIRDIWDAISAMRRADKEDGERLARIETLLTERCAACFKAQEDHASRIGVLEHAEAQRKGGRAMLAAMLVVTGTLGGIVAKLLPAKWGN